MTTTAPRQTADERRSAVLDAATREFARKGLHGASTDDIARAAGISQPYLFRLFGTKKELYLATARRTVDELYEVFAAAARGKTGMPALQAMGDAYETVMADRDRLMLMLKCWASCDDPEICEGVRRAWRDLVDLAERASVSPRGRKHVLLEGRPPHGADGDGRVHAPGAVVEPPDRGLHHRDDAVALSLFCPESK